MHILINFLDYGPYSLFLRDNEEKEKLNN